MSEAKPTPGPWAYGLGYRVRPDRGVDADGREIGGPTICEVNADADRCCPPCEVVEANGRLIAASPDLLAACELWDQGFIEGEQFTPEQLLEWVNKNRRAARAAIAKAKGG